MKLVPGLSPDTQRGLLLAQQGKFREAETYYRRTLAKQPEDALTLHHLANCLLQQEGRSVEALEVTRKAIALEPHRPDHRSLEAFALNQLGKTHDAIEAAKQAVEMAPDSVMAHSAWAQSYLQQHRWAQAENEALAALKVDPENSLASNQLALALRQQNRMSENAAQLTEMLARDPDNPLTQANAGWSALQTGRLEEADEHFVEALRLDPDNESAREGLLSSFRSRTPLFLVYLRYCFAMSRLTAPVQVSVVLGIFLLYLIIQRLAIAVQSPVFVWIGLIYFLVILWIWVAEAVGNFFILLDRRARHSLRFLEKIDALIIGGSVISGLAGVIVGIVFWDPVIFMIALAALWSAIPFSMVFTNPSQLGRLIFSVLGAVTLLSSLGVVYIFWFMASEDRRMIPSLILLTTMATLLSTWLGNIPALRRPRT